MIKASGLDAIPALLLEKYAPEFTPVLPKLCNSLMIVEVSMMTGSAHQFILFYRKYPRLNLLSQLIALLSAISKVLDMKINYEILTYFEHIKLIHDGQYGFPRQRLTAGVFT